MADAGSACMCRGVYGLNKYVLWIGACASVASMKLIEIVCFIQNFCLVLTLQEFVRIFAH